MSSIFHNNTKHLQSLKEILNRKNTAKQFLMKEKIIHDQQMLNNNLRRKITLYQQQLNPSNTHYRTSNQQIKSQSLVLKQSSYSSKAKTHSIVNNRQKQSLKQTPTSKHPFSKKKQKQQYDHKKQAFTPFQKNILNSYHQNLNFNYKQQLGNPFQMALVQLIEKEQQIIRKKQKDLIFWKNKVKTLQEKYKKNESKWQQ